MDAKQAAQIIRDEIATLKKSGSESVTIQSLESVLTEIEAVAELSGKELELTNREVQSRACVLAIAAGTTYLAQAFYEGDRDKPAQRINIISIILVAGSYVSFCLGAYRAYTTFLLTVG